MKTATADEIDADLATDAQGKFANAICAANVQAVCIAWLWKGFIPLGALSLLYGHEGLGKSSVSVALAAMATLGTLTGDLSGKPSNVGIVAYEDDPGAVIVPRLMAAGADLERIFLLGNGAADEPLTLPDDIATLDAWIEANDIRLLIIDPLPDALREGLKDNNNGDVRRAIVPLNAMAGRRSCAVLGVTHPNKGATEAANKVMGSKAWRSVPRSVMLFGADPDAPDGDTRLLAVSKTNYAAKRAVKIRIESANVDGAGSQPRAVIMGESSYTDRDVLLADVGASSKPATQSEKAEQIIMGLLEDAGGEVKASVVYAAGTANDIPEATMRRARQRLNIGGGDVWTLSGLPI